MTPVVGLALFPVDNVGHLCNDSVSTLDNSLRSQAFQSNNCLNDNEQNSGGTLTLKGWRSTQPDHGHCVIFFGGLAMLGFRSTKSGLDSSNFILSNFALGYSRHNPFLILQRSIM